MASALFSGPKYASSLSDEHTPLLPKATLPQLAVRSSSIRLRSKSLLSSTDHIVFSGEGVQILGSLDMTAPSSISSLYWHRNSSLTFGKRG